jgi:hypothetical protein
LRGQILDLPGQVLRAATGLIELFPQLIELPAQVGLARRQVGSQFFILRLLLFEFLAGRGGFGGLGAFGQFPNPILQFLFAPRLVFLQLANPLALLFGERFLLGQHPGGTWAWALISSIFWRMSCILRPASVSSCSARTASSCCWKSCSRAADSAGVFRIARAGSPVPFGFPRWRPAVAQSRP